MGHQARAGEGIVLVLGDQVPGEHGHLPCGGHDSFLEPAASLHPLEERAERSRCPGGRPGSLDQDPTHVSASGLADPAVNGGRVPGLAYPRVQPDIGDQLVGVVEPGEVTHRSHDRDPGDRVDPGDRH